MANTSAQVEAEKWIRETYLPQKYGQTFRPKNLDLRSNGQFKFDAVSDDGKIVGVISTSGAITAGGKMATAKLMKIRSDAYWFLMLKQQPETKLLIFTDNSMIDLINDEKKKGRFPSEFEILKVDLPDDLAQRVAESQRIASKEVSPERKEPL